MATPISREEFFAEVKQARERKRTPDLSKKSLRNETLRGENLLGVKLVTDRQTKTPALEAGMAISQRCLKLGACLNIGRRSAASVFRIAPPLTTTRDEIDKAIAIFDQALSECATV